MRLIDRILWKLPCFLAALALTVACNKIETFDGAFVAFDPIVVSFAVTCGDGLSEGIDYKVATVGGKITFMPGIYEQTIKIDWLPHDIDETKDNTVTISLLSAEGVTLGYPGPDRLMKDLVIRKYRSK